MEDGEVQKQRQRSRSRSLQREVTPERMNRVIRRKGIDLRNIEATNKKAMSEILRKQKSAKRRNQRYQQKLSLQKKLYRMCWNNRKMSKLSWRIRKWMNSLYLMKKKMITNKLLEDKKKEPQYFQNIKWKQDQMTRLLFLFAGDNNNDMLKLHVQTLGKFSIKQLRRSTLSKKYFDAQSNFLSTEKDPITMSIIVKPILLGERSTRSLQTLLHPREKELQGENLKKLQSFRDLLEKCLQLDPKNRISPQDALFHPFITQTIKK